MTTVSGSFFSHRPPAQHVRKHHAERDVIDVGGGQFHAAAVALIDYIQSGARVPDEALKKILGFYNQEYPKSVPNDAYLLPKERMAALLRTPRKSVLADHMARVLRQLTADELRANSTNLDYRDIFTQIDESHLDDFDIQLPVIALEALAKVLNVPITLLFAEPGKELPRRECQAEGAQAGLAIQIQQGKYCFPWVRNKADFAFVSELAAPVNVEKNAADKNLLQTYNQHRTSLLSMVKAEELSYETLRDYYIGLNLKLPQIKNAARIEGLEQARHPVIAEEPGALKQMTTKLLVNRIASLSAVGAINADDLYEQMENKRPSTQPNRP